MAGSNTDISISDVLDMQGKLRKRYEEAWGKLTPEQGAEQLLWMMCEMGEVGDMIKKKGGHSVMTDDAVRAAFLEECVDVLMYMGDVLICYGVSAQELSKAFIQKHDYNMRREYGTAHFEKDDK